VWSTLAQAKQRRKINGNEMETKKVPANTTSMARKKQKTNNYQKRASFLTFVKVPLNFTS